MKTGRYTLGQLLTGTDIEQIIIPEIQRDYVWESANVEGLVNSIFDNYRKKTKLQLDIKFDDGINPSEVKFLNDEFMKLRYSSRIGFIYAYHDLSYPSKYFLIDGQQRLTTLYLLLIALHTVRESDDLKGRFKKKYFIDGLPRIDYKVREASHDFMIEFINNNLQSDDDIRRSSRFYTIFANDVTVKHILSTYDILTGMIKEGLAENQILDFIEYIENYIEFNYFDTNQSAQGERLYLYMNSRGEPLSMPEMEKSMLIERSSDKLRDSKTWEDYQNFFWQKRERTPGSNSDKGFEHFLSMAVMIHAIVHEEADLHFLGNENRHNLLEKLIRERKVGDFFKYIKQNKKFDIQWIGRVYDALSRLVGLLDADEQLPAPDNWINEVKVYIDYTSLLGTIYYIMSFPDSDAMDIKRVYMHLRNIQAYDNNSRNPDNSAILAVGMIDKMRITGVKDVGSAAIADLNLSKFVFSDFDKKKVELYASANRSEWENLFWETTRDGDFNRFIQGDGLRFLNLCSGTPTVSDATKYRDGLRDKIFRKRDCRDMRRQLAEFGDYARYDGNGYLSYAMGRYNFCYDENSWRDTLDDAKGRQIIRRFIDDDRLGVVLPQWLQYLVDPTYECFRYMEQYKLLYEDDGARPHVRLLRKHQASESLTRELAVHLLHKIWEGTWVWNYKYCVLDFDIKEGSVVPTGEGEGPWYVDMIYDWERDRNCGGRWSVAIGKRGDGVNPDLQLKEDLERALPSYVLQVVGSDDDYYFKARNVYEDRRDDTDLTSAQAVKAIVERMLEVVAEGQR